MAVMAELEQLIVSPLMLKKNPDIVITIKKVCGDSSHDTFLTRNEYPYKNQAITLSDFWSICWFIINFSRWNIIESGRNNK